MVDGAAPLDPEKEAAAAAGISSVARPRGRAAAAAAAPVARRCAQAGERPVPCAVCEHCDRRRGCGTACRASRDWGSRGSRGHVMCVKAARGTVQMLVEHVNAVPHAFHVHARSVAAAARRRPHTGGGRHTLWPGTKTRAAGTSSAAAAAEHCADHGPTPPGSAAAGWPVETPCGDGGEGV